MRRRFLSTLFLCALLLGLLSVPCAASDPQPVRLEASVSGRTVTVRFIAAQELTLTNYNVKLKWDANTFTLEEITDGQSGKFLNFLSNPKTGNAAAIAINNVHIGAGETLAIFTLTAVGSVQGSFHFALQVSAAANEKGESLPWQGLQLESTVELSMRPRVELNLSGHLADAKVVCFEQDAFICCAAYGEGGRMLSRKILPVSNDGVEHSYAFDFSALAFRCVKLFLLSKTWQPLDAVQTAQPTGNTP